MPDTLSLHPGQSQGRQTSPGLWQLAWRRLRADRVAMASLAIVGAFFLMLALSFSGLIAADWEDEVGVSYAPPSFIGADADSTAAPSAAPAAAQQGGPLDMHGVADPLADDI
ncbi:MAG: ABC transporter permease, partial [Burkholderiaceae bacterium]|nr:ABC transporter permease [Burkholderiaceae bacterium]